MNFDHIDHFVLTVKNVNVSAKFYHDVLGMDILEFENGRKAASFGNQKINFQEVGHEIDPKAAVPTCGAGDFCIITKTPLKQVVISLDHANIPVELGPVSRSGAVGKVQSVYLRDPDYNLIEISNYESSGQGLEIKK